MPNTWSKEKNAKYMSLWRKNNPDKYREAKKRYRLKNKEKYNEAQRQYYKKTKPKKLEIYKTRGRQNHLKSKYNITHEDFLLMLIKQNGKCAICEQTSERILNEDHCNKTGKIRGLLCWKCNSLIGLANDNTNILTNSVKYLECYDRK